MTREEAIKTLSDIDKAWRNFSQEEYVALEMAIKALEQEPCDEYGNYRYPGDIELTEPNTATSMPCDDAISRQAVIDAIEDDNRNGHYSCFASNNDAQCFKDVIHELPSVNSTKTGHWIVDRNDSRRWDKVRFYCSECGSWQTYGKTDYCPNCGCRML